MQCSRLAVCLPLLVAGCDVVFQLDAPPDAPAAPADTADAPMQPPGVTVEAFTSLRFAYTPSGRVAHTVGAFSGRLLLVALSTSYSTTIASSVTYGAANLTRVGFLDAAAMDGRIELWSLVDPPSGTADVAITLPDDVSSVVAGVGSFMGVNTAVPLGVLATARGMAGDPSVTVTSNPDELVLGFVMWNGDYSTLTAVAGDERWNENAAVIVGAGSTMPGASSMTMGWTVAGGFDDFWVAGAIAIKP